MHLLSTPTIVLSLPKLVGWPWVLLTSIFYCNHTPSETKPVVGYMVESVLQARDWTRIEYLYMLSHPSWCFCNRHFDIFVHWGTIFSRLCQWTLSSYVRSPNVNTNGVDEQHLYKDEYHQYKRYRTGQHMQWYKSRSLECGPETMSMHIHACYCEQSCRDTVCI